MRLPRFSTRGLIEGAEVAAQRAIEEQELKVLFMQRKVGVQINNGAADKYAIPPERLPKIDCAERLPLGRGACCALRFPLSRQDLEEGVMRWTLGGTVPEPPAPRRALRVPGPRRVRLHL